MRGVAESFAECARTQGATVHNASTTPSSADPADGDELDLALLDLGGKHQRGQQRLRVDTGPGSDPEEVPGELLGTEGEKIGAEEHRESETSGASTFDPDGYAGGYDGIELVASDFEGSITGTRSVSPSTEETTSVATGPTSCQFGHAARAPDLNLGEPSNDFTSVPDSWELLPEARLVPKRRKAKPKPEQEATEAEEAEPGQ